MDEQPKIDQISERFMRFRERVPAEIEATFGVFGVTVSALILSGDDLSSVIPLGHMEQFDALLELLTSQDHWQFSMGVSLFMYAVVAGDGSVRTIKKRFPLIKAWFDVFVLRK